MKNSTIAIAVGVAVAVAIGVVAISQYDTMGVKDTMGDEYGQDEIDREIQKKLDDIKQIDPDSEYSPKEREWITSGPFQIDRSEYILGEKIFLRIGGLGLEEKGQIAFLRPLNGTHYSVYLTIPFDGADKPAFNYYIEPSLSKQSGYCTVDDLVGDWRVVFRGTGYPNLEFKVTDQILPGDEQDYEPVC